MGTERNKTSFDREKRNYDEKQDITEKEWILLKQYRELCCYNAFYLMP